MGWPQISQSAFSSSVICLRSAFSLGNRRAGAHTGKPIRILPNKRCSEPTNLQGANIGRLPDSVWPDSNLAFLWQTHVMKNDKEVAEKTLKNELDALSNQMSNGLKALIQIEERKLLDSEGGSSPSKAGSPSNLVH
jgi:hypothetical protein